MLQENTIYIHVHLHLFCYHCHRSLKILERTCALPVFLRMTFFQVQNAHRVGKILVMPKLVLQNYNIITLGELWDNFMFFCTAPFYYPHILKWVRIWCLLLLDTEKEQLRTVKPVLGALFGKRCVETDWF